MRLRFTKMHGLGNDFVVIDAINQSISLDAQRVRKLADRRFGVGCDQVLVVEPPTQPDVDFNYRIFNHDGSEVENCGNGARCFAKFVRDRRLTGKSVIVVETCSGRMSLAVDKQGDVTVDMGAPQLQPEAIPFMASQQQITYPLLTSQGMLNIHAVSMGNPHAVLLVDDIDTAPVETLGTEIEQHESFPRRVNVGFMQICSSSIVKLRVFERGVGETLACGTGACAAVVAGRLSGKLDERVQVQLPGGRLDITWLGEAHPVMMTGPATKVYHGQIVL